MQGFETLDPIIKLAMEVTISWHPQLAVLKGIEFTVIVVEAEVIEVGAWVVVVYVAAVVYCC